MESEDKTTRDDQLIRISELVRLLNEAGRAYEQEDREIISNFEYDKLYDELLMLEETTGVVLTDSPTRRVGYEVVSELPKFKHETPMLSLDKTKSREALADWLGQHKGLLSWKLDGLTVVLTYREGVLFRAVTRGNGEVGEVVTNNARVFKNLPASIPYSGELILRGEAVIKYPDFKMINAKIEEAEAKFKNPRNLCSGAVRQLNSRITAERKVNCIIFSLISMKEMVDGEIINSKDQDGFATRSEQMAYLKSIGFETVEGQIVTGETVQEEVETFARKIEQNDIPSDGLVLSYDDIAYGLSLGRTSKFPRDSIAFKWADEIAQTKLLAVEWSPSRTGLINPIAVFVPVELEGTTVSRASLHNISVMEGLQLGVGDTIEVYKANMIIPQLAGNLTRSNTVLPPTKCPVCGGETRVVSENDAKVLMCINNECQAKKLKSFVHFTSRNAMNMEGLSEATLEKLIGLGCIHEYADLFHLTQHKEKIVNLEGFGERSYENLIQCIDAARTVSPARLIYSLGIPNIGLSNAKLICKAFHGDFERMCSAGAEELTAIEGIGEVIADAWIAFFASALNRDRLAHLLSEVKPEETSYQEQEQSGISGKTFVITGSVERFTNRNALKEYIEQRGGMVTGSVSSKTDYLINNDNMSGSSKNKAAKALLIPVITEAEFLQLAGEQSII